MKTVKIFIPIFMSLTLIISLVQPMLSVSKSINDKVFRLHILANSDSAQDQNIKLKVRDYVLSYAGDMFNGSSLEENISIANKNIALLESAVNSYLNSLGYDYTSSVSVCREYFNTRVYDDFTLPAGEYNSLKIELGKGDGHNWWCIIFPQVCLSGCTESMSEYLTDEELELVTSGYTPKFKIIEFYNNLKEKLNF